MVRGLGALGFKEFRVQGIRGVTRQSAAICKAIVA